MSAAHTPTPWHVQDNTDFSGGLQLRIDSELHGAVAVVTSAEYAGQKVDPEHYANAAFIVRACNSHDALVAFLEKYIREDEEAIAEWERQFPTMKWGKDDRAIKNLEAARQLLKAAKGEA